VRLGFGPNGTPADLGSLGFDTSFYAKGVAQDDMLVFVTDNSGAAQVPSAVVSAQTAGVTSDMKQILRKQSLKVEFTSDTQYTITDTSTNTLLATRAFDRSGLPQLSYRGLSLQFSNLPVKGDIFRIDGNQDGIGNNENMMNLIALEDKKVMPGNLTLTESYIERVNQVGNVSRQASISKDALNVVFTQAKEARDSTSGVSLDEDADQYTEFLAKNEIKFLTLRNPARAVSEQYGKYKLPETYIISRQGRLLKKYIGPRDWSSAEIYSEMDSYLAQQ